MTIRRYRWNEIPPEERRRVLARSQTDIGRLIPTVSEIVETVRRDGDAALRRYTAQFDSIEIGEMPIQVTQSEFDEAGRSLAPGVRDALDYAIANVRRFHEEQRSSVPAPVMVRDGIRVTERATPISRVGLYVPRGRGSFPSMLYMLAVPAVLAGVPHLAVATPPSEGGAVDAAVLYAARACGVHTVYRVGGAQAIAAFAHGTESVRPVYKIVGPGSAYVAAAKRLVSESVDVGLPAGPSESIVLADRSADPWIVALDLMIEAEHGSDSSALLVTNSDELVERVARTIETLITDVPEPRRGFLMDVFSGYGGLVLTESFDDAIALVNEFAPEHLLIHASDPERIVESITDAGEILIGPHTAFSLANYAAGANAVLPTGGWARTFNPVSVRDFTKISSIVHVTASGYAEMRDHVVTLADYEGFYTHAAALRRRDEAPPR
jgi:histidinol dehydrogenase